jgi:hypothetical protein
MPDAMKHLKDAIVTENEFLQRHSISLASQGLEDLLQCKQNEKFYWIPRGVFAEAQKFKSAYFPKLQLEFFFPFLVRLNEVWKRREAHLLRESKLQHRQKNQSTARIQYERSQTSEMQDDAVMKEIDALRREVRLRVSSKAAIHLFQFYERLVKNQVLRRRELEHRLNEVTTLHNHMLADRAPEVIGMQSSLRIVGDTARALAAHLGQKLVGSCSDMRRFLSSLESASLRNLQSPPNVVSSAVVKQLLNCMTEFAEEVMMESQATSDSLRRIADAAERGATDPPPLSSRIPPSDDDREEMFSQKPNGRIDLYDDLVDDDVAARVERR